MSASAATFRIVPAGDAALVVEFAEQIDPVINARAIALAETLQRGAIAGVRDVVPTYRSVAVFYDPLRTVYDDLVARVEREAARPVRDEAKTREPVTIPVCYGGDFGPDLPDVARFAQMTDDAVVALHAQSSYRVFMLGFVPGFAYMGLVDKRIAMPRHSTPRVRVPAGTVGIAGVQTGIYPAETPGGWQLIGRTPLKPFDAARTAPFLMKAGDTVRFHAIDRAEFDRLSVREDAGRSDAARAGHRAAVGRGAGIGNVLRIVKGGMLTTVQDLGRWGLQSSGVPVAGPMDPCSHRLANALVGNDAGAATLEVTLLGPEVEFGGDGTVAVAGAEFELTVGNRTRPMNDAFDVRAGERLRFGARRRGARAYLAVAGGIDVPPTLGSRATHLISGMGGLDGRPVREGDRLPIGTPHGRPGRLPSTTDPVVPLPAGHATIRVLAGPQDDYFAPDALETLQSAPYTIASNSDRMGFRLTGPMLRHARGADIISDATPLGVLQVPASGQPILLMADRQTTGGYPKIATVIGADISVAGQLGPGDTISFVVCSRREALAALIAQERRLMRLEEAARA